MATVETRTLGGLEWEVGVDSAFPGSAGGLLDMKSGPWSLTIYRHPGTVSAWSMTLERHLATVKLSRIAHDHDTALATADRIVRGLVEVLQRE